MSSFNLPGRAARRRRNLPYMFLFLAIVFGCFALVGPLSRWLYIAKESDLALVAGSVQGAPGWESTKGGPIIRIRVEADDGLHDLFEEDLSHSREIINLKPGDHVTARMKSFLGQFNIWELKRDGVTVESYQDVYLYSTQKLEQAKTKALWFGLISSIFLTVAIALRMYFGAWRYSDASVPADAVGPVQPLSSGEYPRTYRRSPGTRAKGMIISFISIAFGFSFVRSALAVPQVSVGLLVAGILLILAFVFGMLADAKYRVVLFPDRIEVQGLVSSRVLRRDEILGRRLVEVRGSQIIRLVPRGGQRLLRVYPLILKTDSAFWEWMDTVPDLDVP
jgi:hypothetical protein